jgi:hypothetical protein
VIGRDRLHENERERVRVGGARDPVSEPADDLLVGAADEPGVERIAQLGREPRRVAADEAREL